MFWETSRLARGLPKTFTYSTWDEKAVSFFDFIFYALFLIFPLAHDVPRRHARQCQLRETKSLGGKT